MSIRAPVEPPSMLLRLARPNVLRLRPYESARDTVQEGILLDANESPFEDTRGRIPLNRYPDPNQAALRSRLAEHVGVEPSWVLAGAGSDEVLDWIFKVFIQPGSDQTAIAEPTYGMYRVLADLYQSAVFEFPLDADFDFRADAFLRAVPERVKILFLCSPNNPTGNLLSADQIRRVCTEWGGLVCLDEAYIEFSCGVSLASEIGDHPHLIVVRTLSKAFGRAGIRLGYAVAHPAIIDLFRRVKSPYNLSALVQREGIEVLGAGMRGLVAERLEIIRREKTRMTAWLRRQQGIEHVFHSECNFLLFRCRDPRGVCRALLEEGIVVRDRSSLPGLAGCVRVSIGLPRENERFIQSLAQFLQRG